jgi:hypothetical protein
MGVIIEPRAITDEAVERLSLDVFNLPGRIYVDALGRKCVIALPVTIEMKVIDLAYKTSFIAKLQKTKIELTKIIDGAIENIMELEEI